MKSEDYKRGVRDMTEAMRAVAGVTGCLGNLLSAQWHMLADPVPKFAVGMVVMHDPKPGVIPKSSILIDNIELTENNLLLYNDNYYEAGLRALTPLEVTGKE